MPIAPPTILDLTRADVEALVTRLGQPRYRVDQLLAWIHGRGVLDPAAMTDLPRALRETLAREIPADGAPRVAGVETSADGTTKIALTLADGAVTETVLIPEDDSADDAAEDPGPRPPGLGLQPTRPTPHASHPLPYTQCLSTQVGCIFRCAFCRSGSRGFTRHLGVGEILAQRDHGRRTLGPVGEIVRTVLMGIGEPLHNTDRVLGALRLLCDPRAGGVSPRRVTVSTIGLPDGIRALGEAFGGRMGIAWSLHAATDEARRRLLPAASRRPVAEVVAALRDYPLPARLRVTVECVLVRGVNDSIREARAIVRLLSGLRCKLNLIPFNPWVAAGDDAPACDLAPPSAERVAAFCEALAAAGLSAFVRRPRGADVLAACGQLLGRADAAGRVGG